MADTVRCAPPLPTLPMLPRVRLIDQFRQRFEVRVLTVLAGAGFGKTTALARAVAENRLEPLGADVWLSCTSADNDLSVLAWGLGTALGVETASADTSPAVTAVLAGAVARRRLEQVVFVLDDVHLLRPGSPGAELLADLVVALPTNAHFVFAGRRPVPFPLARLAASGQVHTVGEEELRFTAEEVAEFAALRGVEPDQLSELGGWPALAELAAQGRGCGVAGTDYLWQELLAGMPAARRRGLAVLSAIGPADADLLARADPVLPPLASVVAEVPMVIHSDGGTTRLHGLWGQALEGVLPAEDVRATRVRAAQAWESRGKVQQAARLLIAAQAFDELVGLCGRVTAPMVPLVPADVLRGWLQALPESLADRPEATLARAVVAEMAHDPSCLALLTDAARRFEAAGDEGGELACHVHRLQQAYWLADVPTLRSVAARLAKLAARGNRFAGIVEVGADATVADCTGDPHLEIALLKDVPSAQVPDALAAPFEYLRARALLNTGDARAALPHARRACELSAQTRVWTGAQARLAATQLALGDLDAALAVVEQMDFHGSYQEEISNRALASVLLALAGRIDTAAEHLTAAQARLRGLPTGQLHMIVAIAEVVLAVADGDDDGAHALLGKYRPLLASSPVAEYFKSFALAVLYVLDPASRLDWERRELSGWLRQWRGIGRACAALQDGEPFAVPADLSAGLVRSALPVRWAIRFAVAAEASGHPLGREVIDAIGPPARSQLLALVTGPSGAAGRPSALAKSAHALLERLPRPVPHQLALGMLGRMTLRRDGVPVENGEWRRERVRQLLAYLVLHPVTTRSAAAAALWPDLEDIAANRNLRVTLTYLGQLLDPQHIGTDSCYFLATDGVLLRLAVTDIGLDVAGFEEALARARAADVAGAFTEAADCLQAAVRLFRGDLLAEFPDAEWAEAERGRLRALFVQAAVRAGEILLAKGDPAGAVALAGRALRAEPYAEAAYRLVIAAHLWSGDRAAALRAHRRCSRMLDELGIAPEPETRILERRLFGRPTASAPRQSPVSVPLSVR